MNILWLLAGIVVLILLAIGGYSLLSDPQEVDAEETATVRRESAEARKEILMRERAQEEEDRLKEMAERPSGN